MEGGHRDARGSARRPRERRERRRDRRAQVRLTGLPVRKRERSFGIRLRGSIGVLMEALPATTEDPATHYLNRELSWLDFNERVLTLAEDPRRPILERLKFIAICSQSLDEFFQIRVSGLLDQVEAGVTATTPDGMRPEEQLAEIRVRVLATTVRIDRLFADEIRPPLAKEGI